MVRDCIQLRGRPRPSTRTTGCRACTCPSTEQVRTTSAGSSAPWRKPTRSEPQVRHAPASTPIRYCIVRGVRMSLASFGEEALTRNFRLKSSLSRSMSLASPTAPASRSSADSGTTCDVTQEARHRHDAHRPPVRRGGPVALRVGRVRLVGVVERRERPARLGAAEDVAGARVVAPPERLARPAVDEPRVLGDVGPAAHRGELHQPVAPLALPARSPRPAPRRSPRPNSQGSRATPAAHVSPARGPRAGRPRGRAAPRPRSPARRRARR